VERHARPKRTLSFCPVSKGGEGAESLENQGPKGRMADRPICPTRACGKVTAGPALSACIIWQNAYYLHRRLYTVEMSEVMNKKPSLRYKREFVTQHAEQK
jgi:hypothetical protein